MIKKITLYLLLGLIGNLASAEQVLTGNQLLLEGQKKTPQLDTADLIQKLKKNPDLLLLDVRLSNEINIHGSIDAPQNVHIPRGWLEFRIKNYADKDTEIIVYCGNNERSTLAAEKLKNMGYSNVSTYSKGLLKWKKDKNPVRLSDYALNSPLYRLPIKVADRVWSAIGDIGPTNYQNSGHNNNLSFIIGDQSVLVFNAGGSYLLARSLHDEIKKKTNKPVKYVVLENTQGHAMLGSSYWQEQGAIIIAHQLSTELIKKNGEATLARSLRLLGDKIDASKIVLPDLVFEDKFSLNLGGILVELRYFGASHSPENISLWLPEKKLLITGDNAFNERMLPIFEFTDVESWFVAWDKIVALEPKIIIPGHGNPTDLATIEKFTIGYLEYLHSSIEKILAKDGDLADVYNIDQSAFKAWRNFKELSLRNAGALFKKMEFK